MRDNTERPITVEQGTNTLVGRNRARTLECVDEILKTGGKRGRTPELWDGRAGERIADDLSAWLGLSARRTQGACTHESRQRPAGDAIVNALTIDVEDYFQVSAFAAHIPRSSWDSQPCRVEANIDRILGTARRDARSARRSSRSAGSPSAIRRWSAASSTRATSSRATATSTCARTSRDTAPSSPTSAWPRRCSRTSPAARSAATERRAFRSGRPISGRSTASPKPAIATARASIRSGTITTARPTRRASPTDVRDTLLEVPVATVRMLQFELAGRRRRLFPSAAVSRVASGRSAASTPSTGNRRCSIFTRGSSIPTQPRVNGPGAKARFRHYLNLDRTEPRLRSLLADFRWDRVDRVFLNGAA